MKSLRIPDWKVQVFLLATLLIGAYGVWDFVLFMKSPYVGIYGELDSEGYRIERVVGLKNSESLTMGTHIKALEGTPIEEWVRSLLHLSSGSKPLWPRGDSLEVEVRDEKNVSKMVLVFPRNAFMGDFFQGPFWRWVLAVFILFCGAYLEYRYTEQHRVQVLSILLLATALSIFNLSGKHLLMQISGRFPAMLLIRLGTLSVIFSSWLYLILIFLEKQKQLQLRPWIPWAVYAIPLGVAITTFLAVRGSLLLSIHASHRILYTLAGAIVIFTFMILMRTYRKTQDPVFKAQLKWLLWGHILGMSPYILFYSLPKGLIGIPLIPYHLSLFPFPLILFSYLFAFYRYRLMDVDRVIHGSIVYGVSVVLLFSSYLLVLGILHQRMSPLSGMGSWFRADLLLLLGAVLIFNPLKNVVQKGIDRTLFPERLGLSHLLIEGSNLITRSSSLKEIADFLLKHLAERISVEKAALALRQQFGEGLELYENPEGCIGLNETLISNLNKLSRENLPSYWDILSEENGRFPPDLKQFLKEKEVALIFPMVSGDDLWGFYFVGNKMTKRLMSPGEIRVIGTLCTQAAHMVGNTRLMEGLRRTNRSLAELSHRLMEAEHMADLGEGAAILAHELRNPLGIVRGSAEILLRSKEPTKNEEILSFILEEVDRLSWTIDEFLQFARMSPPVKSNVDLNDLVRSAAFLWESRRKSAVPVEIRYQLDHHVGKVPLDSKQIYQVLLNIFTNAEEAMPGGGELLIMTGILNQQERAWISVGDTGKGISQEHLHKVFDRFFTTKETGLGLGLSVVKKVMEAHGGMIQVESSQGSGTKVALFFPLSENLTRQD